jgi:SAM-dependent methyltransferase
MAAPIDAFTSPTLKHLRESWWDDDFTEFLKETLRPRSGNRILDVGCGEGLAQVSIGRLHISQIRLVGIDLFLSKVAQARKKTKSHNLRAGFAAADACHLPFGDGAFDSLYCVAVLQHIGDVRSALSEFARVTARNGRILAVEPDNSGRYVFSSVASGQHAFEQAARFFDVVTAARGEKADTAIGPKLPGLFAHHGIEPIAVRLFPVSHASLGQLSSQVWATRREAVQNTIIAHQLATPEAREAGLEYLAALDAYQAEAVQAGPTFVEIQNTMLFAAVGQKA